MRAGGQPASPPDPSFQAFIKVRNALQRLVNTEFYTRIEIERTPGGEGIENRPYYRRDKAGHDFVRNDILFFNKGNSEADPRSTQIHIVNLDGQWELSTSDELVDIAFRRTDGQIDAAIQERETYIADSKREYAPTVSYSGQSSVFRNRPVTEVTTNDARSPYSRCEYIIDNESGALVAVTYVGHPFVFDTISPVPFSLFEIPEERIELPAKNIEDARTEIMVKVREKQ